MLSNKDVTNLFPHTFIPLDIFEKCAKSLWTDFGQLYTILPTLRWKPCERFLPLALLQCCVALNQQQTITCT